ncbi:TPA: HK97 gp10 family phage protein, partial [Enterobacter hormaechei]|nr:HK97 gp10 family phage protein [Enterobacter hormaechei]EKY3934948.1 HK97 gp10 family phage protein [Enterobacter hormaechei]EKY3947395.1 HK97 gp10 family phage protein [Enterobacter hormaechei]
MGIKVKGISQAKKHLNDVINDVKGRKVIRALQSAMMLIGARAAYYTPIDSSTLINSQFREIDAGGVL